MTVSQCSENSRLDMGVRSSTQSNGLAQDFRSEKEVRTPRKLGGTKSRHALLPTNQSDANAGFSILFEFSVDNCAVRKTMTELICEYGLSKLDRMSCRDRARL